MATLQLVSNKKETFGASLHVNPKMELELLGHPIWLSINDFKEEAFSLMENVGSKMSEEHFYHERHRELFKALVNISLNEDKTFSEPWIRQYCMDNGTWSDDEKDFHRVTPGLICEAIELGNLKTSMLTGLGFADLVAEECSVIKELFRKRRVAQKTQSFVNRLPEWNRINEPELSEMLEGITSDFYQSTSPVDSCITMKMGLDKYMTELESEAPIRTLSGFHLLDNYIGGFLPGNIVTIGGRTSMGKTALALDIALSCAKDELVLYISCEMSCEEITQRIISKRTGIRLPDIRSKTLTEFQIVRLKDPKVYDIPLIVDDDNMTPAVLEQRMVQYSRQAKVDIGVVFVDFIQIFGASDKTRFDSKHRQIAEYTTQLKRIAKERGCVIFILSQISRQGSGKLPTLQDMKESGSIEENSDCVLAIYRPFNDSHDKTEEDLATLRILKNRSGPTGDVQLVWHPETATFKNMELFPEK